jgi:hypothetical protein
MGAWAVYVGGLGNTLGIQASTADLVTLLERHDSRTAQLPQARLCNSLDLFHHKSKSSSNLKWMENGKVYERSIGF